MKPRVRVLPADNKTVLEELTYSELVDFEVFEAEANSTGMMLFSVSNQENLLQRIMKRIEFIRTESDLLDT